MPDHQILSCTLHKIISGGQTGVDRAGLDAALAHGIPLGGYCPKGRLAEDGPIPAHYPLVETDSPDYAVRTRRNVRESNATLVLNIGPLTGGTRATVEYALQRNKPCMVVQLDRADRSLADTADWITEHNIRTLNIAGPRESKAPGTHNLSLRFLNRLLTLLAMRRFRSEQQRIITLAKGLFPSRNWPDIHLVGGIVRDLLIGKTTSDIDIVSTLPQPLFKSMGFRYVEGKSGPAIMFRYQPGIGKIEATLIPAGEPMADELSRRDFRCNAMAMTLDGRIVDPLRARHDMKKMRLHPCSDRTFIDDPIRIFRACRFEADGWRMSSAAEKLVAGENWENRFALIPIERFTREMQKALAAAEPVRFFRRMQELNIGTGYLPELFRMAKIPAGPVEHHPEGDLFSHSCQVLERLSVMTSDPLARFCAFFHDLGKFSTDPARYPKHHGHDDAGFTLATAFCERLKLPAAWKRALAWANRLHDSANKWEELRDATKIRMTEQAIKGGIEEILPLVSASDRPRSPVMPGWETALKVARMTAEELGIPPLQLEMVAPENRGEFILQKRIEALRKSR